MLLRPYVTQIGRVREWRLGPKVLVEAHTCFLAAPRAAAEKHWLTTFASEEMWEKTGWVETQREVGVREAGVETEVTAPQDGKVKSVDVAVGDAVQGGQVLIEGDD